MLIIIDLLFASTQISTIKVDKILFLIFWNIRISILNKFLKNLNLHNGKKIFLKNNNYAETIKLKIC